MEKPRDLSTDLANNTFITVKEIEEKVQERTVLKTDCSLCSVLSEGKGKFEEIIREQISNLQNRFLNPLNGNKLCGFKRIFPDDAKDSAIKSLVKSIAQTMDNIVMEGPSPKHLEDLEKKLTFYHHSTDGKLNRRKVRMRQATEYLTKHIIDLERMLQSHPSNDKETVDKALLKLLKIRGIIEDICLLCQRVGSAQKEDSLSGDIKLLVQSLDKLLGSGHLENSGIHSVPVAESIIVPEVCGKELKECNNRRPFYTEPENDTGMDPSRSDPLSSSNHSLHTVVESEIVPTVANKENLGIADLLDFKFETLDGILDTFSKFQNNTKPMDLINLPFDKFENMGFITKPDHRYEFVTPKLEQRKIRKPSPKTSPKPRYRPPSIRPARDRSPSFLTVKKPATNDDSKTDRNSDWKQNSPWILVIKVIFDLLNRRMGFLNVRLTYAVFFVLTLVFTWCFPTFNFVEVSANYGKSSKHLPWFLPASDYLELRHYGMPPV